MKCSETGRALPPRPPLPNPRPFGKLSPKRRTVPQRGVAGGGVVRPSVRGEGSGVEVGQEGAKIRRDGAVRGVFFGKVAPLRRVLGEVHEAPRDPTVMRPRQRRLR